jgi:hypothetical protein
MNSTTPAQCKCGETFTTDSPFCPPCCATEFGWTPLLVVDEITQQWDYNENADWTQDFEFLNGLHDPTIGGKELLSGLLDHETNLTDAQWGEVLCSLRRKFPLGPEWDSCAPMACGCCACGICHDAKREHCECPE